MITLYKQDGETLYGIKEFLIDTKEDVKDLPTNIKSGSSAMVIDNGEMYILNSKNKWIELNNTTSEEEQLNEEMKEALVSHLANLENPHQVNLSQLGVTSSADELNYSLGLEGNIQEQLNKKIESEDLNPLVENIASKADQSDLATIQTKVDTKAEQSDLNTLQEEVSLKASASDLNNYLPIAGGKINGDLNVKDKIILKDYDAKPGIEFHYDGSSDFTSSVYEERDRVLRIGGEGQWGYIEIDSNSGLMSPVTGGNYSLGSDGAPFYKVWASQGLASSLAELKTDITPFNSALEEVCNTDVCTYRYKKAIEHGDNTLNVGFVIGDGYNCSELLMDESKKGIIMYSGIGIAFGAIKELYEIVKQQQEEIDELKRQLNYY